MNVTYKQQCFIVRLMALTEDGKPLTEEEIRDTLEHNIKMEFSRIKGIAVHVEETEKDDQG